VQKKLFVIVIVVLLLGVGAICYGRYWQTKYVSLSAVVENAGGEEFIKLIGKHNDTAIGVHNDIVAVRIELQSAIGRAAEAEQRNQRAYEYAKLTDGELVEFGSAMASHGNTLQDSIRLQQRTIDFVGRIEANNSAIKAALRSGP